MYFYVTTVAYGFSSTQAYSIPYMGIGESMGEISTIPNLKLEAYFLTLYERLVAMDQWSILLLAQQ